MHNSIQPETKELTISQETAEVIDELIERNFTIENTDKKFLKAYKNRKEISEEELQEEIQIIMRSHENKSHFGVISTVAPRQRVLAYEMVKTLIKEFECKKESELRLVDLIVTSYCRYMHFSERVTSSLSENQATNLGIKYMSMLMKDADRAYRQYLDGVNALERMKAPAMKVSIKANNAFVAENQLFQNN